MEKERVKKGEEYWYVSIGLEGVNVFSAIDFRDGYTNLRFRQGNYFHTEEEAESMARKLRAVLKGAEIMEDWQKEKIASWDTMLETKDEISKNYSKLLNNPKVQAVLKGADVIEMPSEEEISRESDSSAHKMDIDDGETPNSCLYWRGWGDAIRWLKSKIVK